MMWSLLSGTGLRFQKFLQTDELGRMGVVFDEFDHLYQLVVLLRGVTDFSF